MGYATIVSGGTNGRYVVSLDYGETARALVLAALSLELAAADTRLSNAQTAANDADALEAQQAARYTVAVDAFIAAHGAGYAPGSPKPDDSVVKFELQQLRTLQVAHLPLRVALSAAKFVRADIARRIASWTAFDATETRSVWCTDFTEDAAPGAIVATLDIPGESTLMVLAPGCRAWTQADGEFFATQLMSPEQAYFNTAILPGWQIDKPTYRWGTVTAVNYEADTLDVTLGAATSSAQRLNVNRETALAAVPVDYMETGASVFEIDDRVVVKFIGQSWDNPRVEGFLDNPRPARWSCATADPFFGAYVFLPRDPSILYEIISAGVFECKVTDGPTGWQEVPIELETASQMTGEYRYDNGLPTGSPTDPPRGAVTFVLDAIGFSESVGSPYYLVPPHLTVGVAPGAPMPPPARSLAQRAICEFRIKIGSEVVFNSAFRDLGHSGEGVTTGYVKTAGGGINLQGYPNLSSVAIERLTGYTLTGRTT